MSDRSIWEGKYADLWSITHVISGTLIAFLLLEHSVFFWPGLGISVLVAGGWELIERFTGLASTEAVTNSFADILFAQLGFATGYELLRFMRYERAVLVAGLLFGAFVACVTVGWASYAYYRNVP